MILGTSRSPLTPLKKGGNLSQSPPSLRGATAPLRFPDLYPFGEASYAQRLRQGEARGVDLGGSQSICYQEEDLFIHPLRVNFKVDICRYRLLINHNWKIK